MWQFNPRAYGALAPLLAKAPLNEIGPGNPQNELRELLAALTPETVVAPHELGNRDMAAACCAAMWLRFDFLDQSHHISQEIDTPEGSFWHGIMHRREPDFANAKYWFRRSGGHSVGNRLAEAAQRLAKEAKPDRETAYLLTASNWDTLRFVDLCEHALDGCPPIHTFCKRLQQTEWELLFDYCYQQAIED